jgi:hypothetical protein
MRFISTRTHGMLDYPLGVLLIAAPWLLGFEPGAQSAAPVTVGILILFASLMTNYELGLFPLVPMRYHLGFDVVAGAVLALSPWLFGFAGQGWVPHLVLGLVLVGAGLCTETVRSERAAAEVDTTEERRRRVG